MTGKEKTARDETGDWGAVEWGMVFLNLICMACPFRPESESFIKHKTIKCKAVSILDLPDMAFPVKKPYSQCALIRAGFLTQDKLMLMIAERAVREFSEREAALKEAERLNLQCGTPCSHNG